MEIHRYRKDGSVIKTENVSAHMANSLYVAAVWHMDTGESNCYRITMVDEMSMRIVKDSDYFIGKQ